MGIGQVVRISLSIWATWRASCRSRWRSCGRAPIAAFIAGKPFRVTKASVASSCLSIFTLARKAPRLVAELQAATWKRSAGTDTDFECRFSYQPEGWEREYRYAGLRYDQPEPDAANTDQMGFFEGLACRYRVFVTNIGPQEMTPDEVVNFYNNRAAVENLIKESNNDIGLTAHPSGQWAMDANHFQLSKIAYNLNCWLQLFQREEEVRVEEITHRTTAIARLRSSYLAARIARYGGQTEIH